MNKYRPYLIQIRDQIRRKGYVLTLTEIKQTVRYRLQRDTEDRLGYYGWDNKPIKTTANKIGVNDHVPKNQIPDN